MTGLIALLRIRARRPGGEIQGNIIILPPLVQIFIKVFFEVYLIVFNVLVLVTCMSCIFIL